jgi:hypothetical protein
MEKEREYVYVVSITEENYMSNGTMTGLYTASGRTRTPNEEHFVFKTEALARDFMKRKIEERLTWGDEAKILAKRDGHDHTHLWYEFTSIYVKNPGIYGEMFISIGIANYWVHDEPI